MHLDAARALAAYSDTDCGRHARRDARERERTTSDYVKPGSEGNDYPLIPWSPSLLAEWKAKE